MKKHTVIPLVLLALVISMSLTTNTKSEQINPQDALPTLDSTLLLFRGTDGNATVLITHNPSVSRGAIYKTNLYNNVTIWYSYVGGDNLSAPLLFGDDGLSGLDWDIGTLMTYDNERTDLESDGSAYYNYTFFITTNFVSFIARYGEWENEFKAPHLITIDPRVTSILVPDVVYTQLNDIEYNLTVTNYNFTAYGLRYREVTPEHDTEFQNVTVSMTAESMDKSYFIASFSHSFDVDTEVEVRAFIVQFDNMTLENRILHENWAHTLTIQDTSPEVELTADSTVNLLNFSLLFEATAPYSNITLVEIDWDDLSGIQALVNVSFDEVYHLYAGVGEYNISVTAYSETLSSTEYFLVLIEQEDPTGKVEVMVDGNLVEPSVGETIPVEVAIKSATFQVSANDTGGSGVWKISLETDEGNLVTVEGDSGEITLLFMEYGEHDILMTVYDNSDNTYTFTFSVDLIPIETPGDNPVPFPFGLTTIAGLITLAAIYLKKKK